MNDNFEKPLIHEGEINLLLLIKEFWKKKLFIFLFTSISAISSVLYSLNLPNIYQSSALLAPSDSRSQGASSGLGGLSSLAGIAGISIPNAGDSKMKEALAILNSHQFIEDFIIRHDLVVPIMASKGWDKNTNNLILNDELYNVEKKIWYEKDGKSLEPSIQQTVKKYREMVSSTTDKKTGYTQISAETYSPSMSKDWVDWLVRDLNEYIMEADLQRAKNSLDYLNTQINQTSIPELKQVMAQLIKTEQQTIMLSQSSPDYVFKMLDKPIIPELKIKPKRAVICIVGTISGFIITLLITLALIFRKQVSIN